MGYRKKQYYEDDFVMNHFERLSDDFVFLDKVWPSVAATATISATGSWPYMDNGSNITLKNAAGESIVITLSNATATSSDGVIGGDLVNTPALMVQRIAQAINATTDTMVATPTDGSNDSIIITQATGGTEGNQTITTTNTDSSLTVASAFANGAYIGPRATATISATGAWPYMDNGSNITLKDVVGTSIVMTLSNATAVSSAGVIGGDGVNTAALMVQRIAQSINATTDTMTASPIDGSADSITITQTIAGSAGNQAITTTNTDTSLTIDSTFINGNDHPVPFSYATKGVRLRLNPDAYKTNLG